MIFNKSDAFPLKLSWFLSKAMSFKNWTDFCRKQCFSLKIELNRTWFSSKATLFFENCSDFCLKRRFFLKQRFFVKIKLISVYKATLLFKNWTYFDQNMMFLASNEWNSELKTKATHLSSLAWTKHYNNVATKFPLFLKISHTWDTPLTFLSTHTLLSCSHTYNVISLNTFPSTHQKNIFS